jgi:prevent-host-death family protein
MVTVRDLRNRGGEVLTRVARGAAVIVTRDGTEVAKIRPLRRATVSSADLIVCRTSPPVHDLDKFRADSLRCGSRQSVRQSGRVPSSSGEEASRPSL